MHVKVIVFCFDTKYVKKTCKNHVYIKIKVG